MGFTRFHSFSEPKRSCNKSCPFCLQHTLSLWFLECFNQFIWTLGGPYRPFLPHVCFHTSAPSHPQIQIKKFIQQKKSSLSLVGSSPPAGSQKRSASSSGGSLGSKGRSFSAETQQNHKVLLLTQALLL